MILLPGDPDCKNEVGLQEASSQFTSVFFFFTNKMVSLSFRHLIKIQYKLDKLSSNLCAPLNCLIAKGFKSKMRYALPYVQKCIETLRKNSSFYYKAFLR